MLNVLSLILAGILLLQVGSDASARIPTKGAPQEGTSSRLRQRVLEIPPASMVQVRLSDKEKLHGRLGQVADKSFMIEIAHHGRIENRAIAFTDVKSIKVEKTGSHAANVAALIVIGAIAGAVIFILVVRYSISHQG